MNRLLSVVLGVCWVLWATGLAAAGPADTGRAWNLYNQGKLGEAGRLFERVIREGRAGQVEEARLGLSYVLMKEHKTAAARETLAPLVQTGFRPGETVPLMLEIVLTQGDTAEARRLVEGLPAADRSPWIDRIERGERRVYEARLQESGGDEPAAISAAHALLSKDSQHAGALEFLAWQHYRQNRFAEAEERFQQLLSVNPGQRSGAVGLAYARLNSGRAATALEAIDAANIPDDDEIRKLRSLVYPKAAAETFEAGQYREAADFLSRSLALDPGNREHRRFLAWARFKAAPSVDTLDGFAELYGEDHTAASAQQWLDAADGLDAPAATEGVLSTLAASPDPAVRQLAADRFTAQGQPLRAATVLGAQGCVAGAAGLSLGAGGYYRFRDGDDGTSRFAETAMPVGLRGTLQDRWEWHITVTAKELDSSTPSAFPLVGSAYRVDDLVDPGPLRTEDTVWLPALEIAREGRVGFSAGIGTTPMAGVVSETVTGFVRLGGPRWHVEGKRCAVDESLLSYGGLEDPYGEETWGRVVQNGLVAGYVQPLARDWWASVEGGWSQYEGRNTWDNDALALDLAAGRSWKSSTEQEATVGLFVSGRQFRRNTNYFTFGHGGYFSPQAMVVAGPFARLRSGLCDRVWYDLRASVGYLYLETDDSPMYPLLPTASGRYRGESTSQAAVSLRGEVLKQLGRQVAVGVFGGLDNSTDYLEWTAGFTIRLHHRGQQGFWRHSDSFQAYSPCRNR